MSKPHVILAVAATALIGTGYSLQQTSPDGLANAETQTIQIAAQSAPKPLYQMTEKEVDAWLPKLRGKTLPERMDEVSARALNTPYFLGPLGEGPAAPFDKKPLMDLSRVDCVTFCEQTLALSLAKTQRQAYELLQKIRYKGGERADQRLMETRNHYFMADWVPNNRWLLNDVTPSLPGRQSLTRTISHKQLFSSQKLQGIQVREPDRSLTIHYVPDTALKGLEKYLKSGDIGVLIQNQDGIFAAHTGIMFKRPDGNWVFRNATSLAPKRVVDTPWPELISSLQQSKRLIGMSFVRPRQQP